MQKLMMELTCFGGFTTQQQMKGGPGGSSTGFGNFKEIGPLDVNLNERNTTWLGSASLLFVDNPVGAGYSYATKDAAYTHNSHEIATNLVTLMSSFLEKVPDFKKIPFYIFSESYGGKMAAAFAKELLSAIQESKIDCNFKGVALGDSWIAPLNSTLSWGPYLYATSLIDGVGLADVDQTARQCEKAVISGDWFMATTLWSQLEDVVEKVTFGVNWYNILQWARQYKRHVEVYANDLHQLMNGPIRDKLKIIPKNVTWGGQSEQVFEHLKEDFMKDIIMTVSKLLETDIKVVVYSGQLDLIVNTMGTEQWINQLQWSDLEDYIKSPRKPLYCDNKMAGYIKKYKNFSFYWILKAGHMVPADQGETALVMLNDVINN
ncbi:hypothetical protein LSH36_34g00008 [Paralvinella palmiformis]|uniref:Carboxypeptidase n=1 Tax=Paralvinella palmiformis TaxID=53620 RepID=A0AAD9K8W6_9ANNE|nr:hypothetical protein LSH36_34g00008 [Paralvinella palmiformis]